MIYSSTQNVPRIDPEDEAAGLREPRDRRHPPVLLAAGVLAASDVSFVLVGSGALWLRGRSIPVRDVDAVIEPAETNLRKLSAALSSLALGPWRVPPARDLGGLHLVSVTTSYGRIDALLERGRLDWCRLRASASLLHVADAGVLVASASDAWSLRRRYKE